MDEIIVRYVDLPTDIHGFTVLDREGDYNMYLNARDSMARRSVTYRHELKHINGDDFYKRSSSDLIEIHAHR